MTYDFLPVSFSIQTVLQISSNVCDSLQPPILSAYLFWHKIPSSTSKFGRKVSTGNKHSDSFTDKYIIDV